jgi:hypothetical protein
MRPSRRGCRGRTLVRLFVRTPTDRFQAPNRATARHVAVERTARSGRCRTRSSRRAAHRKRAVFHCGHGIRSGSVIALPVLSLTTFSEPARRRRSEDGNDPTPRPGDGAEVRNRDREWSAAGPSRPGCPADESEGSAARPSPPSFVPFDGESPNRPQTVPKPSPSDLPVPYRRGRGRLGQLALLQPWRRGQGLPEPLSSKPATTEVGTSTRWSTSSSWCGTAEKIALVPAAATSGHEAPSQVGSSLDGLEPVVIRQLVVAGPDPLEFGVRAECLRRRRGRVACASAVGGGPLQDSSGPPGPNAFLRGHQLLPRLTPLARSRAPLNAKNRLSLPQPLNPPLLLTLKHPALSCPRGAVAFHAGLDTYACQLYGHG